MLSLSHAFYIFCVLKLHFLSLLGNSVSRAPELRQPEVACQYMLQGSTHVQVLGKNPCTGFGEEPMYRFQAKPFGATLSFDKLDNKYSSVTTSRDYF